MCTLKLIFLLQIVVRKPALYLTLLINNFLSLQPSEEVPSEFLEQTLTQLRSMGYEDEGGWLTELVKAKGGDISKVLDALHPTVTETD